MLFKKQTPNGLSRYGHLCRRSLERPHSLRLNANNNVDVKERAERHLIHQCADGKIIHCGSIFTGDPFAIAHINLIHYFYKEY